MPTEANYIEEIRRLKVHIANLKVDHDTKVAGLEATIQMQEAELTKWRAAAKEAA